MTSRLQQPNTSLSPIPLSQKTARLLSGGMSSSTTKVPETLNAATYSSPKKYNEDKATEASDRSPESDQPVLASFDSSHLTIGAGVAIFHIATARVVVCYHSVDGYWFLPKGRRDAGEDSCTGAEREGFEEVCAAVFPRLLLRERVC